MADKNAKNEKTALDLAREAATRFGNMRLTARLVKIPRREGNSRLYIFRVEGTPEALEAYKTVMREKRDKNGNSVYREDTLGRPLMFTPSATKRVMNLIWTDGDPDKNPLGSFVQDDMDEQLRHNAKVDEYIAEKEAEMLVQRRFGQIGNVNLPKSASNESYQGMPDEEELEIMARNIAEFDAP